MEIFLYFFNSFNKYNDFRGRQICLILAAATYPETMKSPLSAIILIAMLHGCGYLQDPPVNYTIELGTLLDSLSIPHDRIHIRIDKTDYLLSVMADSSVIKQYPVVFGSNPSDDKLRQGDGCTPEGRFKVRSKYPHRSWSKFIWIDYPTEDSWVKHRQAKLEGLIDESAGIGGEIGIHGVPSGTGKMIDLRMNWTLGCISLKNEDINDLYPYVSTGTVVIIEK